MSIDAALRIRGLSVRFPMISGSVQAVDHLDLDLGRGEILGLVGESGCGKTVTSSACLGLLAPPAEVRGSIRLGEQEIVGCRESLLQQLRGERIAMIFQNPMAALNPYFTIGRQLTDVIRRHRSASARQARAEAANALHEVRLPDPRLQLDKYPHQLSGGQLQRVMIAMALSCKPRVLIADEPTTALDVTVQAQILVLLEELVAANDMSVLFITHDLGLVSALCHSVAVMYAGRLVEAGPVAEVFSAPAHPYTKGLLGTVPELGSGKTRLQPIPGNVPSLSAVPGGCSFHPRCRFSDPCCEREVPALVANGPHRHLACHHPLPGDRIAQQQRNTL